MASGKLLKSRGYVSIGVLLATVLVPWSAVAGTAADPEVVDPAADTRDPFTNEPVVETNLDLLATWFASNPTHFEIHTVVQDLRENTPEAYRTGVVSQQWDTSWQVGSQNFAAHAGRDIAGNSFGALAPGGQNTMNGGAQLVFDSDMDVILLVFPRQVAGSYDFADGTTFAASRVGAREGLPPLSTQFGCGPCRELDTAGPGRDFTFPSAQLFPIFSGEKPFEPINVRFVKLDGVETDSGRGTGSFDVIEFKTTNRPKALTFNGVTTQLSANAVVTIHDFEGRYFISGGAIKFDGLASSFEV